MDLTIAHFKKRLGRTDQIYGPHYRPFKKALSHNDHFPHLLPLIHAMADLVFARARASFLIIFQSAAEQPDHHQNMPPKKPAKHDAPATNGAATPKGSTPTTVSLMDEPMSPPASSAVTTRAASTHDRTRTNRAVVGYQSPLKKLRTAMRSRRVIDTIDGTMHARCALDSAYAD